MAAKINKRNIPCVYIKDVAAWKEDATFYKDCILYRLYRTSAEDDDDMMV